MSDISEKILAALKEKKISYGELAALTEIPKSALQRYASGATEKIPLDRLESIAHALRISPSYLMGWDDDPYDYDIDECARIASIPSELFRDFQEIYGDDMSKIWHAYCAMDEDAKEQAAKDNSLQGILAIPNIEPMPQLREIPLLGSIACGEPILAQENIEEQLVIPAHIHADFALRCKGDSMVNARIYDGDIVYIRQQPDVEDGEIAAVLIDDEATLKRVYKFAGRVQLRAENPRYQPLEYSAEDYKTVRVLGKAVAFTAPVI